jgi:hypothetical protein
MLGNKCLVGTRVPIEDGVDGAGVYASRLWSRCLARGSQSPKVSSHKRTGVWTIFERHFGGLCMVFKVIFLVCAFVLGKGNWTVLLGSK